MKMNDGYRKTCCKSFAFLPQNKRVKRRNLAKNDVIKRNIYHANVKFKIFQPDND